MSNKKIPLSPWKELRYVQNGYGVFLWMAGVRSLPVCCPWLPLPWGQHFVPASPAAYRRHPWASLEGFPRDGLSFP
ncbi:MAG: hypothetical protein HFI70_07635 [Lachnospiraceae bacterium]|nr:hypothetical protein [Lachnospiraceae bacterium]